jgi:hypothetical protein
MPTLRYVRKMPEEIPFADFTTADVTQADVTQIHA